MTHHKAYIQLRLSKPYIWLYACKSKEATIIVTSWSLHTNLVISGWYAVDNLKHRWQALHWRHRYMVRPPADSKKTIPMHEFHQLNKSFNSKLRRSKHEKSSTNIVMESLTHSPGEGATKKHPSAPIRPHKSHGYQYRTGYPAVIMPSIWTRTKHLLRNWFPIPPPQNQSNNSPTPPS